MKKEGPKGLEPLLVELQEKGLISAQSAAEDVFKSRLLDMQYGTKAMGNSKSKKSEKGKRRVKAKK